MTSRDFVYWLQGYFEILDPDNENAKPQDDARYVPYIPLGPKQVKCIREHLQLVFQHEINPPVPKMQPYAPDGIDWARIQREMGNIPAQPTVSWLTDAAGGVKVC